MFRLFRAGQALLESGVKTAVTVRLSEATISLLRGRLKMGLSARALRMSESSAKHMLNPGRYVPLQIQEKAIRYGTRTPDPLKSQAFSGMKRVCINLLRTSKIKAHIFTSHTVLRF